MNEWSFVHLSQVLQCDSYLHIYEDECDFGMNKWYLIVIILQYYCSNTVIILLVYVCEDSPGCRSIMHDRQFVGNNFFNFLK